MARLAESGRPGVSGSRYRLRRWRQLVYSNTNPDPYSDAHAHSHAYSDSGLHIHYRGDGHPSDDDLTRNTDYRDRDGGVYLGPDRQESNNLSAKELRENRRFRIEPRRDG